MRIEALRTLALLGLAPLLAGGCVTAAAGDAGAPIPVESEAIAYETGPCFGACPVYRVTVRPDGSGTFEGRRFTSVTGERQFRLTPDQYRAFAAHLAPLRPREGSVRLSGEACSTMATDLPSAEVTWFSEIGNSQSYYLYYGCDMDRHAADRERLERAPSLLPIAALIGR
jgi:hypothetical protein